VCCGLFGLKVIMSSSSLSSTSQSSSTSRSSSTSKPSFSIPRELVGSPKDSPPSGVLVVRVDNANVNEESSRDTSFGDPPLRSGCYWVSDQVLK